MTVDIIIMLILAAAIALTFMAIVKKYNPTITLFVSGLILMAVAYICGFGSGKLPLKAAASGVLFVDLFKIITEVFKSTFNGLGLYILTIGGFAYFIEKIGSGQTLVYYAIKPLRKFKNPYIVLTLAFYLGVVLNIFIDSAAGLGLLLATTIYPILRGLGLSKVASASVISTTGSFALGPLSSIGALNAELLQLQLHEYFFNYKVYTSVGVVLFAGIVHFFWQQRADAKDALKGRNAEENEYLENADLKPGHPILAFIPVIPVLIMFIPIMNKSIKMDIATVMFCTMMISILIVGIVNKMSVKESFQMLNEFFVGMSKILSVVILIVAGQIFASGLISMGAVNYLVEIGNSLQIGGIGMSLIFSACSFLLAALIGSGNAAIIAFANLSPDVAAQFSIPLIHFLVPLHDIAILGRPLAPVAGVIIAVAGIVKVDVIALVRRNVVPMIVTAVFAFVFDMMILSVLVK